MKYFDYESVARAAKTLPAKLEKLVQSARAEFPNDDLMCELHVLRACMAIRDGHVDIDSAIRSAAEDGANRFAAED